MKYMKITHPALKSWYISTVLDACCSLPEIEEALIFEPVEMSDEEYEALPEFKGF